MMQLIYVMDGLPNINQCHAYDTLKNVFDCTRQAIMIYDRSFQRCVCAN